MSLGSSLGLASRTVMAELQFDPSGMLQIDMDRGIVQLRGASPRLVVPTDALVALCGEAGPEVLADFGQRWGTELGARAAGRLGAEVTGASVETWLAQLGGEWALAGLGNLAIERWGQALVITVADSPVGETGDPLIVAILAGALQRLASRDLTVLKLSRAEGTLRTVVLAPSVAERVRAWLGDGSAWADVLVRLHDVRGGE